MPDIHCLIPLGILPAHVDDRWMEACSFFNLPDDASVLYLMCKPAAAHHFFAANKQAANKGHATALRVGGGRLAR